jgi:hypothetical protein
VRNKILTITRNTIPYVKELRRLAPVKSVNACLLMQQLDYWFERYPNGFFKFLEPCEASGYQSGDSWCEELGISADEFRNAFDQIGIRYKSKKEFDQAAGDKFQGRYYCSYTDKIRRQTWYYRNHAAVDAALDTLSVAEAGEAKPTDTAAAGSRDGQGQVVEAGNDQPDYTETTTDITTDITHERDRLADASSHSDSQFEGGEVEESSSASLASALLSEVGDAGGEILDAVPVFAAEPHAAAAAGVAVVLPADFRLIDEMRAWAAENKPDIDVDAATRKFVVYNSGKKHKDWLKAWAMWILNERPSGSTPRLYAAGQQEAELENRYAEEFFAAGDENESFAEFYQRLWSGSKHIPNPKNESERRANQYRDEFMRAHEWRCFCVDEAA